MKAAILLLALAYACRTEAAFNCKISKGQKLDPVNGKSAKLDIPCKFIAVDQMCGQWKVKITPGNIYMPPRYFLDTVWVEVAKGDDFWEGRTATKIAIKYINDAGDVREPFTKKGGNLATDKVFQFSKTGEDVTATAVDGAFSITFGPYDVEGKKHRNVDFEFTCNEDDEPVPFPQTICGSSDVKEVYNTAVSWGFQEEGKKKMNSTMRDLTYYYAIFTENSTFQTTNPTCGAIRDALWGKCTSLEKRVDAIKRCHQILYSKNHRKCVNRFSCDIIDVFYNCVMTVCDDFKKSEWCTALGEAIDVCREFKDLSGPVNDNCFGGLFIPIDENSVYYEK